MVPKYVALKNLGGDDHVATRITSKAGRGKTEKPFAQKNPANKNATFPWVANPQ